MSEISILFLFYVFEFIDMLAFGAYRFHFLASVWIVDMAIQAGLLLLFFLLRVAVAGCCSMLCSYARTLELLTWRLPCTLATDDSVSVSVLVFILLYKGQILLAAKYMKTDGMRHVCNCARLTSVQEMKNFSTRSHLPMRLSWSVRHKLCQAWR